MARKRIISVGFSFPGNAGEYIPFRSDRSLLDADIIVFEPQIHGYSSEKYYQNKLLLYESDSFQLVEDCSHWKSELHTALDSGKTIFIFLCELQERFIYSGEKTYSGTGRSRVTTSTVIPYNNYKALPVSLTRIVPKRGSEIRVARDLKFLAPYWKEFSRYSVYEVYLEEGIAEPLFITKTGNKPLGGIHKKGKGTIIFLPPLRYNEEEFVKYEDDEEDDDEDMFGLEKRPKAFWTTKAIEFGNKLASYFVEVDRIIRSRRETTPPPDWVNKSEFRMDAEAVLENKVRSISAKIEELQNMIDGRAKVTG
jgi:hypothetical protein